MTAVLLVAVLAPLLILIVVGVALGVGHLRRRAALAATPLETSTARVVAKRTGVGGGRGQAGAGYFATFLLPGEQVREMSVSGQQYARLTPGDEGVLRHRGDHFDGFAGD